MQKDPFKINPKDFTDEQINEMWERQGHRCLICGIRLTKLDTVVAGDPHHIKRRSSLTAMDLKKHGPGGGSANGILVCRRCHNAIHRNEPGMQKFQRKMWEEVPSEPALPADKKL